MIYKREHIFHYGHLFVYIAATLDIQNTVLIGRQMCDYFAAPSTDNELDMNREVVYALDPHRFEIGRDYLNLKHGLFFWRQRIFQEGRKKTLHLLYQFDVTVYGWIKVASADGDEQLNVHNSSLEARSFWMKSAKTPSYWAEVRREQKMEFFRHVTFSDEGTVLYKFA